MVLHSRKRKRETHETEERIVSLSRSILKSCDEIPIFIETPSEINKVPKMADETYLESLLDLYKDQIKLLKRELDQKNLIILDFTTILKQGNTHVANGNDAVNIATQTSQKPKPLSKIQSRSYATQVNFQDLNVLSKDSGSLLDNNWVKDDISLLSDNCDGEWQKATKGSRSFARDQGNPLILKNRFCGLLVHEPVETEKLQESLHESFQSISDEDSPRRRPTVIPPKFPERGDKYSKKVVPGNKSYADHLKYGKSVCLVGDSILGRIRVPELNKCLREGGVNVNLKKKFFPGAKAHEVGHYILPTLDELQPDVMIIHVGTNNLQQRNFDATTLASEILDVGQRAVEKGVGTVFISSITQRKDTVLQRRLEEDKSILERECNNLGFIFISNEAIVLENICNDGVHLLDSGMNILANNFINYLSTFLR